MIKTARAGPTALALLETSYETMEKRRKLMDAWAAYCEPRKGGNVVPLKAAGRR
jgi:hypothetical protein